MIEPYIQLKYNDRQTFNIEVVILKIIDQIYFYCGGCVFIPQNPGQVYSIKTDAVYPYKPYPRLGHFGEGNRKLDFSMKIPFKFLK